jgi:group I intron endonuclease
MSREVYIYTLSSNDDIRYVGRTFNVNKRFRQHINESYKNNTHKSNWIRKVKNINIEIVDVCDEDNYSFWEQHYISLYKSWGFNLLNMTIGGEGISGYKYTEEDKLKRSIRMLGNKNHFYGKNHTLRTIEILSNIDRSGEKNSMYGKKHKEISKKIMSNKKLVFYDGVNNPRAKKLYQYNLDNKLIKCWDFAKECADFYNISRGNISSFSKNNTNVDLSGEGKYRILSGFIFKYH